MNRLRRFAFKLKHEYFTFDNILIFVAVILCLFWTYGSISSMSRNWKLASDFETRKKELALLNLEVETLELENDYYRSDEYKELSARKNQNKKTPRRESSLSPGKLRLRKIKNLRNSPRRN